MHEKTCGGGGAAAERVRKKDNNIIIPTHWIVSQKDANIGRKKRSLGGELSVEETAR